VVGVVTSVISGYFYLRLVFLAFMSEGQGEVRPRPALGAAVALAAAITFLLGVYPGPWFDLARDAVFSAGRLLVGP
jgi:NADH-quinone oxidoreductase subunit N